MLLDNKTRKDDNQHFKVYDFIKDYTEKGSLDLVTGFFSINALALMKRDINQAENFRLILGNLLNEEAKTDKVVDLLYGNPGIDQTLSLSMAAKNAVEFLQQDKVQVKTIQRNFCHAKTYIYTDEDPRKNFHIVGSSNLTDAGLGLKESSNIELNTASTGDNNDYRELKQWFKNQWENVALEKIELPDKSKVDVKQYIIELIKSFYKEYQPEELYYKVLYELFKDDLLALSGDAEFKREIAHLEETLIYQTLFSFQQKGVISLIKMLQKYNGAILADAVGLGKTWTALAVMKYFELKGYTVLLLCPKKLSNNWEQYKTGGSSRFEKDEIDFYIRYHTDLQEGRFDNGKDKTLQYFKTRPKLLVVIDESHNLRNDKSARYNFLVEHILLPGKNHRDVKVLHLSATPINNKLLDLRNQFKLITRGLDDGFKQTDLEVESLETIFREAQKDFNEWDKKPNRKIAEFIARLPQKFEKLTDALIVARTRKLIEREFGEMKFPEKLPPENVYITTENLCDLKSFDDILDAIEVNLSAYRPAEYIAKDPPKSILEDEKQRQRFLVKMMYILLIKRLESSWFAFKKTVENILEHHLNALEKVERYIQNQKDSTLNDDLTEDVVEEIDETAAEISADNQQPITLGKKNPVPLSSITDINRFKAALQADIAKLTTLKENLVKFETDFNQGKATDPKLDKLIELIKNKQATSTNQKVLVFTVFKDTAKFLYEELKKRGLKNVAYVSGTESETFDGERYLKNFEPILQRFAPYTKLYKEKDWTELYEQANLDETYKQAGKWQVPYELWLELIAKHDHKTLAKVNKPIDILIATDCLSEGQNLQDCDTVVNYDIHWNPVRLIQRMGRIDRIGSPNKTIKGINFWPAKSFDEYLNLKTRVENRMALMSLAFTELEEQLTPELQKMIEENPLLPKQQQKLLEQLRSSWEDVEVSDETLGLNDLTLEQFRQDLFEFFKKNEEFFKKIPNGVYTGFRFKGYKNWSSMPDSIVAVLGYPKRPDDAVDHVYSEIFLLHQNLENGKNQKVEFNNKQEILSLLRQHKGEQRYVPPAIERGEKEVLSKLSAAIGNWLNAQKVPVAVSQIQEFFTGQVSPAKISPEQKKLEDKFKPENFDLINWFVISNK